MSLLQTGRVPLNLETVWFYETSESLYRTARRHNPQESRLHTALNIVFFLACMFFDIIGLHCGEYHLYAVVQKYYPYQQRPIFVFIQNTVVIEI